MRGFYYIAGIRRATIYSPHSEEIDNAIFIEVLKQLEAMGHEVKVYNEEDLIADVVEERYIYNMVRSQEAVFRLQALEQNGVIVVNSGFGIEHCGREQMTTLLLDNGVPFAPSQILEINVDTPPSLRATPSILEGELIKSSRDVGDEVLKYSPSKIEGVTVRSGEYEHHAYWVKRADGYTVESNDVAFVSDPSHLKQVLDSFAQRGLHRVVISEHLQGDLVKFYGVVGTDFFHWFYPQEAQHSKFGYEAVNGAPSGFTFSVENLQEICRQAAQVLGVEVYGGDAVIATDGTIRLIDFNDWPSFAPCRLEAAKAIAQTVIQKIERYDSRR